MSAFTGNQICLLFQFLLQFSNPHTYKGLKYILLQKQKKMFFAPFTPFVCYPHLQLKVENFNTVYENMNKIWSSIEGHEAFLHKKVINI